MHDRLLVISADCHAAAQWPDYEPYFEREHLAAFREWYGAQGSAQRKRPGEGRLFATEFLDGLEGEAGTLRGGRCGTWDPALRARELEEDGIAAEVIFPGAENCGVPFHGRCPATDRVEPVAAGLRAVGARVYNRWLADLCAAHPERRAGIAVVDFEDVDGAVTELRRARESGLRGGMLLPSEWGEVPSYNHPRYEPIWRTCAELGLTVNCHATGTGRDAYGALPGATAIFLTEIKWFAHRPLHYLLWSGVFERYPELKFVLTEQMADWVPGELAYLDDLYARPIFAQIREGLPLLPSEYFRRQCAVGASFMFRHEVEMRHQIGVEFIMWGSDYPHAEGTWPRTRETLAEVFRDVPETELEAMLGGNAARFYGFDPSQLRALADRVGPERGAWQRGARA
jgi:predicted TIM-barrel fold metal-dependent hydrolase